MKKGFLQLVLSGLLALSVATAGLIIAEVSLGHASAQACPACNTRQLNCPGSPCLCQWNGGPYVCVPAST